PEMWNLQPSSPPQPPALTAWAGCSAGCSAGGCSAGGCSGAGSAGGSAGGASAGGGAAATGSGGAGKSWATATDSAFSARTSSPKIQAVWPLTQQNCHQVPSGFLPTISKVWSRVTEPTIP